MIDPARFATAVATALSGLPPGCRPWGRGWSAAVAGVLEAAAAKPGTVHPAAGFPDLCFEDLAAAALAAAPALDAAADRPLGETILAAVSASRTVSPSNANLGIVLLIAPLAAVPDAAAEADPLAAVEEILATLDAADAADVWRAIALACPGGLGRSDRWDLAGPPPADLRAAMRHAARRDTIARLWANGYRELFQGVVADLTADLRNAVPLAEAIARCHLRQLVRCPDSLLARRHGEATAAAVSTQAARVLEHLDTPAWGSALAAFDRSLREPRRLNPGTTADLIATALYILLRDGRLRSALPFRSPPLPHSGPASRLPNSDR
jgi:triphosphoribosyl-dephospho-CoA synthase